MSPQAITSTLIVVLKTITLLLGALITYLAYKAYTRTGSRSLQYLSLGFAIVTFGSLLAGLVDQVLEFGFRLGQIVETALLAVGFAVIVLSLYATD
jgi:hypothetical protein